MGLDMYLYRKTIKEVAYWRKANAIHGWIINRTGDIDDGSNITLNLQDLVDLRNVCQEVHTNHTEEYAMEQLPPTPGFFFGSYELDDRYWSDVEATKLMLTEIIDNSSEDTTFEYYASW